MNNPAMEHRRATASAARLMVAFVSAVLLAACSSASAGDTTPSTDTAATAASTTVVTTTTEAPLSTVDEPLVPCDAKAFKAAFGTKMRMGLCTTTWATGDTDRDTWNCPDEGCPQTRLMHLVDGAWKITATCTVDQPLTYWKASCYRTDLNPVTSADVPSNAIACKIWPANTMLRNVSLTGCTPSKSVIDDAINAECTRWTENFRLPLEKCDSGRSVRVLQKALRAAGHDVDPDGYYGGGTVKAVLDVQAATNLPRIGLVDMATWKAIFPANAGLTGSDTNGDGVIAPDELK